MVKIGLFPYHKCKIKSPMGAKLVGDVLKDIVDQYGDDGIISSKFYGEISGNKFSIYKSSYFFHTTIMKINGEISETKEGSLVDLTFLPSEYAFTFILLFELLLTLIVVFTAIHSNIFWKSILPIPMMVFGYLMLCVPFSLIGNSSKKTLLVKLKGDEV